MNISVLSRDPCSRADAAAALKQFIDEREGSDSMANDASASRIDADVMTNLRLMLEHIEGSSAGASNKIVFDDEDDAADSTAAAPMDL
jgi:hypothetical protein